MKAEAESNFQTHPDNISHKLQKERYDKVAQNPQKVLDDIAMVSQYDDKNGPQFDGGEFKVSEMLDVWEW